MSVEEVRDIDDRALAAWDAHDIAAFTELFAETFTFADPNMPEPLTSRDQVRAYMEAWFTAFPDLRMSTLNRVISESQAAGEVEVTGTHNGPLAFGDKEIPATGRNVKAGGTYFATVEGGKIVSFTAHPDAAALMGQLGLMPGAG